MRVGLVLVVGAAFAAFFLTGGHELLDLSTMQEREEELRALYEAQPVAFAAVFFVLYALVATTSVPGGAVLTMGAGAIFGVALGALLVSFASTIGATAAFLISRYVLGDWVRRRFGARLEKLDEGIRREGAAYLFMVRLVPAIPFLAVNVGTGLTRMPVLTYYWVSQAGMLAGTVLFAHAGRRLAELESPGDALSLGVVGTFVALAVVPLAVKKIVERLRARRAWPASPARPAPRRAARRRRPGRRRRTWARR